MYGELNTRESAGVQVGIWVDTLDGLSVRFWHPYLYLPRKEV